MEFKPALAIFKKQFDREIEKYLDGVLKKASKKDVFVADALRQVKKIALSGGKRLRPALMHQSYVGLGGKNIGEIYKTSVSTELTHIFLLIHDDIIDCDEKRHGKDTLNFHYKKLGKTIFSQENSEHFGNSIALIIGDMVGALGNQVLFESTFEPKPIIRALHKLQDVISSTVIGQAKDIYLQGKKGVSEEEILKMYEYKTACYTFEGPMQLGAIFAGAEDEVLEKISRVAIPLGVAFQIRDDVLGIFGAEEKTGKPVGSDIREKKQTILFAKAWEKADHAERKILDELWGKKNLKKEEVEIFRDIIRKTGSLEYAGQLVLKLTEEAKAEMKKIDFEQEAKNFLSGLAEYIKIKEQ